MLAWPTSRDVLMAPTDERIQGDPSRNVAGPCDVAPSARRALYRGPRVGHGSDTTVCCGPRPRNMMATSVSWTGGRIRLTPLDESVSPHLIHMDQRSRSRLLSSAFAPVSPADHRRWFEDIQLRPDTTSSPSGGTAARC